MALLLLVFQRDEWSDEGDSMEYLLTCDEDIFQYIYLEKDFIILSLMCELLFVGDKIYLQK